MNPEFPNLKASPIIAVDDEPNNLKLLGKMLRAEGYTNLVLLEDPRDALDACVRLNPAHGCSTPKLFLPSGHHVHVCGRVRQGRHPV